MPDIQQFLDRLTHVYPACSRYLLAALEDVQNRFGFIPELAVAELSRFFDVQHSEVREWLEMPGVFRRNPLHGQVIRVCCGPICSRYGGKELLFTMQTELDVASKSTTVVASSCLGDCDHSPVVKINNEKVRKATSMVLTERIRCLTGEGGVS